MDKSASGEREEGRGGLFYQRCTEKNSAEKKLLWHRGYGKDFWPESWEKVVVWSLRGKGMRGRNRKFDSRPRSGFLEVEWLRHREHKKTR